MRGRGAGGVAEGDGDFGFFEIDAVVGEGLAVGFKIGDGERRFVLEELELVNDARDGGGVGGPVERLGELPRFAGAVQRVEDAGGVAHGEGADVGGLGAEDAAAGFKGGAFGAPVALEFKNEKERIDS